MLTIGTKAIDFSLPTITEEGPKQVTLSEEIGEKNILLLFIPMAFTPVCTTELCKISQEIIAYEALDCMIYALSGDNPFAQKAWAKQEGISIPLLSDYEHTVAKSYGIAYESFLPHMGLGMGGVSKRSAFLIDRSGIIQYAESSDDPRQLPNFKNIQAKLSELN